ncbi:hypothetical protein Aph02nite_68820 [Actinoplanes philippinensis]|uniref:Uncharacterized protein n=1 Tax=Actinoplanes philippinensis TaxID=35752 RepID=A0A1I2KNR1_9ACTN|nr:hypothetical protein [Actinoplanes philippinensis]GIE80932.1 hypothetical protein Aph02nite_68820 [Actinoplanes philippinensis]SFF67890.1 hypothetical protein SAMN05421541_117155 [Actinoplanes philippinensis]
MLLPEKSAIIDWVDCGWRPPTGAPWVTVNIRIHLDGSTPHDTAYEYAERDFTKTRDQSLNMARTDPSGAVRAAERTTPSGAAVVIVDAGDDRVPPEVDELRQTIRIGNALITVKLYEARETEEAHPDKLMTDLVATADAITAEFVEHLARQQTAPA